MPVLMHVAKERTFGAPRTFLFLEEIPQVFSFFVPSPL